jgi:predicted restriction endonuclease
MPARNGPGFEHEATFRAYCLTHGVESAPSTYRSCMNSLAAHLNCRLGPEMLRSETDIQNISARISETEFNRKHRSNFKSVLRKYLAMVRSNYEGEFDDITPVAIDVDASELPKRVRAEISRIVRDVPEARALKRRYKGQCQLCGEYLEIAPGEFYLEVHHLQPLGKDHKGPDLRENMICVCPNCHVLLDLTVKRIKRLKVSLHAIGDKFISYHNDRC